MIKPQYSVVIPVFNSAAVLPELFGRLRDILYPIDNHFEVIFIDDFSGDKSWSVLMDLKRANSTQIKILRLSKNYGQHNATLCGLNHANGDYIITLDDDLQHLPEEIPKLIKSMNDSSADVVYGVSDNVHYNYRNAGSKAWKYTAKAVDNGMGNGSAFRLIKRYIVDQIKHHRQFFVFIDELLPWYTSFIHFEKVKFNPNPGRKSGYSLKKLFNLTGSLTIFYGSWPLKMMTYVGLLVSFLSFSAGIYFIIKKIAFDVAIQGFTALIVTILFSTSLILLCFGIIGQYLINAYTVLNQKPSYSIKEKML